jgi:prepilin-type N-terminal cleavage/methylation domain-containing protein
MHTSRARGFTLIELLVVIAIIGILSAVVLASLSTARQKGQDAAVQSDLQTIQTQAEIYYGAAGANSYGATVSNASGCPTAAGMWADPNIKNAVNGAIGAANGGAVNCNSTATAPIGYAIQAKLTSVPTGATWYYCVDSSGKTGTSSIALASGVTACP